MSPDPTSDVESTNISFKVDDPLGHVNIQFRKMFEYLSRSLRYYIDPIPKEGQICEL